MFDVISEKKPYAKLKILISPDSTRELIAHLRLLSSLAGDGGMLCDNGANAARVATSLANDLESGLARLVTDTRQDEAVVVAKAIIACDIDKTNDEYLVRVFHATSTGVRGKMAISRPFDTQIQAENFYTRTANVHRAKANRDDADAFIVVLGVQDSRKWRKDRNLRELKEVLCDRFIKD